MGRFIVSSVSGWNIHPSTGKGAASKKGREYIPTSYYVLDITYCHKVVASFEAEIGDNRPNEFRKECAEILCASLNKMEDEETKFHKRAEANKAGFPRTYVCICGHYATRHDLHRDPTPSSPNIYRYYGCDLCTCELFLSEFDSEESRR